MSTAATIIAALLAAIFLFVGFAKLFRAPALVAEFERFGYPSWSRVTTGAAEVVGAALLLSGIAATGAGIAGAALLIVVMLGALGTHLRVGDRADKFAPVLLLLSLLMAELVLRASA